MDGVVEFLLKCRSRNIPIVVATNLTSSVQLRKVIRLDIETLIDDLISSEQVGIDKGNDEMFKFVLSRWPVHSRKYVWFIGDEPHDVPSIPHLIQEGTIEDGVGWIRSHTDNREFVRRFTDFRHLIEMIRRTDDL